jgi:outer membrane autotransporter protein
MSRNDGHTHRAASVARPMLRNFQRGLLALLLLLVPLAGMAQDCILQRVSPASTQAFTSQPVQLKFTIVQNDIFPCANVAGDVLLMSGSGTQIVSVVSAAGTNASTFSISLGEEVTINLTSAPSDDLAVIQANCDAELECQDGPSAVDFTVDTIQRQLQVASGDGARGDPGTQLPISVLAANDGGTPPGSVQINWTISGPGTLLTASTFTDVSGNATNTVTVSAAAPGAEQITVTAVRDDDPSATAIFGLAANTYELEAFDPAPGTPVQGGTSIDLSVSYDFNDAGAAGETITWALMQGPPGTLLSQAATLTDPDGLSVNSLTVGAPNQGSPPADVVVQATVHDGTANERNTTFTLTPFDVVSIGPSSGGEQSADVGSPLPSPLVAIVTRNGAADTAGLVNWSASPANGVTFSSTQTSTDGSGNSSVNITSVNAFGDIVVTATHQDDATQTAMFTVTGTGTLTVGSFSGDGQSAAVGTQLAAPLQLTAFLNGAPQSGVQIDWSVSPAGAATLDNTSTTTDVNGVTQVVVTVGNSGGPFTVTATRADDPTAQHAFGATAIEKRLDKPAVGSGDGQSAPLGQPLPQPLVAQATLNGAAESGVTINWSVVSGAATLGNITNPTDGAGQSSAEVTFSAVQGPVVVRATRSDVPTEFEEYTVTATGSLTLDKPVSGSGDGQSGAVNTALAEPLVAIASNAGTGQSGITVTWAVVSGSATLGNILSPTDSSGQSSAEVTLGSTAGPVVIRATRSDVPSEFEDYTVTAVGPKTLDKPLTGSGDGQTGTVNTVLPQPLVAVALSNGAPESAVAVTWSVVSGSATLGNISSPTDGGGQSSAEVTLGGTAGPVVIRATRADIPGEFEDYTVTATSVLSLEKPSTGSGDGQTGAVGQTLPLPLKVIATSNGTPQSGVAVAWAVVSGSATLGTISSPSDNSGLSGAQVILGPTAGPSVIRATRADAPGVFEDYTVTATDVKTLDKPSTGSGDGQAGRAGTTLPQPLVVVANDNGLPVGGVVVTWQASGGATLSQSSTVTDDGGHASVSVTFGSTPGNVTVTATRQDAPTATASFVLTSQPSVTPALTLEKPADSGDGSSGAAGAAITLTARALRGGVPDANVDVFWELVSGDAGIGATQSFTGADGIARTVVTLGDTAGGEVLVRASRGDVNNASVLYTLHIAGTGTETMQIVSGNDQTATPGSTGAPLVVQLLRNGQPVNAATVAWQVLDGDATLTAASTSTGADGTSQNGIVFGDTQGEVHVRASSGSASAVFTLRIADATGLSLRVISGNNQRGPAGTHADAPLVVGLTDANGEPVAGQLIDWSVISGSAMLDAPGSTTDESGRASQGFRFGPQVGPVRLRAVVSGSTINFVLFDATSVQPTLAIVSGDNQTAPVSTLLPQDLVVGITLPATTKTLAGVTVNWEVIEGGGTLASATTTTGADGRTGNKLTLGPASGANRVRASIDGASVVFTATGTAEEGPLTIVSGNNQTLPTRSPSAPLVVSLATVNGVPIVGASLLWTPDNAELASVRTITDEQGRASNIAEVLLPGVASVTVQVEGSNNDSSVTFAITGGVANVPGLAQPREDVANAIDTLCPALVELANPTPEQADLRARCLELVNNAGDHPDQVDGALEELRQDVALAQANAAFVTASAQFDNLKTRIAALRSGASGADFGGLAVATSTGTMPLSFLPSSVVQAEDDSEGGATAEPEIGGDFSRWGFFASGIVGRGSQDGSSVTPEYDFDTNGITAGVDYRVNDQWVVGASLGYNQQDTELTGDGGNVDTDGFSVSAYTTWFQQNNWYIDGVLTAGSNDYDLQRRIRYDIVGATGTTHVDQVARASTSGDTLSAAFSFGRDFQRGALSFGPYLRGMYTRVDFDSYAEELDAGPGAGLGLAVDARELTSMTGVLGGKLTYAMSRDWGILMPHFQLEWEHEFEDDPQQLVARFLHDPTGTAIRVEGDEVDTDYYNIGIGLSALFANGRSAFLYYEHLAGSEGLSQDNLSLGVRIEF